MEYNEIDILLVEDNIHDVRFITEAFAACKTKMNLFRLEDGVEAVNFLWSRGKYTERKNAHLPKLILTDIRMPKMDGLELLKVVKSDPATMEIPVVILTSSLLESDMKGSYQLRANSYLTKPMDFQSFVDKMKVVFEYWLKINIAHVE